MYVNATCPCLRDALFIQATLIHIWCDVVFVTNFYLWISTAVSANQFDLEPTLAWETAIEQARLHCVFLSSFSIFHVVSLIIPCTQLYVTAKWMWSVFIIVVLYPGHWLCSTRYFSGHIHVFAICVFMYTHFHHSYSVCSFWLVSTILCGSQGIFKNLDSSSYVQVTGGNCYPRFGGLFIIYCTCYIVHNAIYWADTLLSTNGISFGISKCVRSRV